MDLVDPVARGPGLAGVGRLQHHRGGRVEDAHRGQGVGVAGAGIQRQQQAAQAAEQLFGHALSLGRGDAGSLESRVEPALLAAHRAHRPHRGYRIGVQQQRPAAAGAFVTPRHEHAEIGQQELLQLLPAGLADIARRALGLGVELGGLGRREQQPVLGGRRLAGLVDQGQLGGGYEVVAAGRDDDGLPVAGEIGLAQHAVEVGVVDAGHHLDQCVAGIGAVDDDGGGGDLQLVEQVGVLQQVETAQSEPGVALGQQTPAKAFQRRRIVGSQFGRVGEADLQGGLLAAGVGAMLERHRTACQGPNPDAAELGSGAVRCGVALWRGDNAGRDDDAITILRWRPGLLHRGRPHVPGLPPARGRLRLQGRRRPARPGSGAREPRDQGPRWQGRDPRARPGSGGRSPGRAGQALAHAVRRRRHGQGRRGRDPGRALRARAGGAGGRGHHGQARRRLRRRSGTPPPVSRRG
ncbi:hypothetical protein RA210_U160026 [Rubrivivax sp. A210]|nr:hypothetical protein RA210_U160026 [Rubrivivax sp. A210]